MLHYLYSLLFQRAVATQRSFRRRVPPARRKPGQREPLYLEFLEDRLPPTVSAITPSTTLITDNTVGNTFTISVAYTDAMDTSVNPTITFAPDVSSTLTPTSGNWDSSTNFVESYAVANANTSVPAVDVTVSGGQDTSGNAEPADTQTDAFAIATQSPTVSSVTPSSTTITQAQVGQNFTLTVDYSTAMNTSVNPDINFTPAVSSTLSATTGSWSNATTFVQSYAVASSNTSVSHGRRDRRRRSGSQRQHPDR
jgi:hypothetical protein